MRQKRNVKPESEEIPIILFEHVKTLCQVENERNIDESFEHGKRRSQAEKRRIIELSFHNAVLIKASLFRKKYWGIFGYSFSEKSNLFSRNLEKRFRPFARPGRLWFMATVGRKGLFVRSCSPGRMPLKELLMLCAGQSRKSAPKGDVSRKRKTNLGWDCMSRGGRQCSERKKRACCHFDSNNRSFFWVNRIREKTISVTPKNALFLLWFGRWAFLFG